MVDLSDPTLQIPSSNDVAAQHHSFTVLADPLKFVLIVVLTMVHLYEYTQHSIF
jgi:hypothetical protein